MSDRDDPQPPIYPSAAPEGLAPGQSFGQYTLVEEVGRGGMGVVWRAHHPVLHRDDALKFLSPQLARSEEARERFIREGRSASALKHSGIATVYSAGETDGKVYIAQEFIDGTTVSELVKSGPLAAAEAFRVAIMAGRAIGYAHDHNVLHRDVTSRNVMITRDGNVVVVDFGLAVVQGATRFTQSGAVVGTLPYMAPEQFISGTATEASDVYSLGVVLYEMLTGSLPFKEEYAAALMWAISNRDPEPPSARVEGLDPEVDRIVARVLAKDPAARYPSAEALVADLESLLQRGVLSDVAPDQALVRPPSPPSLAPTPPRPTRRKRLLIVAAGAGVAIALGAYLWGRTQHREQPAAFRSVAVLPFEVVGPASDLPDWLLSGLGEQLTAKLAKVGGCRVVTWTSSRRFPAKDQSVRDIAKELGVEGVVLVSVRSTGDKLTGSISLVDGDNEFVRWSGDFEQEQSDLIGIEHQLAVSVTQGLFGKVSGEADRVLSVPASHNPDAYQHYLMGANAMQEQTPEANSRALAFFDRAIALDPQLVDAYIGAGAVHHVQFMFGWEGGQQSLDLSIERHRKALELDPTNMAAIRGLIIALDDEGQIEENLRLGSRIPIDADATVDQLLTKAVWLLCFDTAKANPLLERIIALEPSHEGANWYLVATLAWSGEYERCIEQGEIYFSKFGEDPEIHLWVAKSHEMLGHIEEASVHYRRSLEMFGDNPNYLAPNMAAMFFLQTGRTDTANEILTTAIEQMKRSLTANPANLGVMTQLAMAYSIQGDRDQFLKIANQCWKLSPTFQALELVYGYYRVGLEDTGAEYFCELVDQRLIATYWLSARATPPASFQSDGRSQACLADLRRWHEEIAQQFEVVP
jgi:TolB-like protein/tetratricopeptide (TPR) repeat protein